MYILVYLKEGLALIGAYLLLDPILCVRLSLVELPAGLMTVVEGPGHVFCLTQSFIP